jgi:hypothetical protein
MLRPCFAGARLLVVILACVLGSAATLAAQPPSGTVPARLNAVEQKARDAVLARYRALSIQNGIVLVPLSRIDGVDSIELHGGTIAINGHAATGAEVRERLGRDADVVLELSYFDGPTQQRILVPGAAREAAGATPVQPEPAAAPPRPSPVPEAAEPLVPPAPERAFTREVDARVRVFGDITIDKDEEVNGAVVAVGGSVRVDGRVRDNVVAVGGNVYLGPHAEVLGDVTAVGGTIERDPGATVSGHVNDVAVNFPNVRIRPGWNVHWAPWFNGYAWPAVRLFGTVLRMVVFALLAMLILMVAPQAVKRVEYAVTSQPWKSALVGLLAQLFFVPLVVMVIVVLAISIIGIPLLVLVPFGVLAFFAALMLGFTGAACGLARLVRRHSSAAETAAVPTLLVGLAVIWTLTLIGRLVGLGGGPLMVFAMALLFVGVLVEYAAWTVGLGGALITRFGRYGALPPEPVVAPPAGTGPIDGGEPPIPGL